MVRRGPGHVDVLGWLADVTGEREAAGLGDDRGQMEARGVMAAGLAHELNQPLAVMALAAENALEALEEGEGRGLFDTVAVLLMPVGKGVPVPE